MLFLLILALVVGFCGGIFVCIYLLSERTPNLKCSQPKEPDLPNYLKNKLDDGGLAKEKESCVSLNFILQFLFQERQYDIGIHQWLTDLLNKEFKQLLKHKTLSKIIQRMQIQNLNLGSNLPQFKTATPSVIDFVDDSAVVDTLSIDLDIEYTGGFELVIDALCLISQKAVVKIKVMKIAGRGRLQLLRTPFTHWGFAFLEEPEVDFHVESSVLGHHLPKFKSIIISQLKNVIRSKHTLPYYKLRMAPLFNNKQTLCKSADIENLPGKMAINICDFKRLQKSLVGSVFWCGMIVSEVPVVAVYESSGFLEVVQDIKITKERESSIGFLTDSDNVIDWIVSESPAYVAGIRKGDTLLAIGTTLLSSNVQLTRLVAEKQTTTSGSVDANLILRIKRPIYELPKKGFQNSRSQSLTLPAFKQSHKSSGIEDIPPAPVDYEIQLNEATNSGNSTPEWIDSPETPRKSTTPIENITPTGPPKTPERTKKLRTGELSKSVSSSELKLKTMDCDKPIRATLQTTNSIKTQNESKSPKTEIKMSLRKLPSKSCPVLKYFQTDVTRDSKIDADFDFELSEDTQFITLCLWSNPIPTISPQETPTKESRRRTANESTNSSDWISNPEWRLVGYVTDSIKDLLKETNLNSLRSVTKRCSLKPGDPTCAEVKNHLLVSHKGFDPEMCYGDVFMTAQYVAPKRLTKGQDQISVQEEDELTDNTGSDDEESDSLKEPTQGKEHNFKKTQFTSSKQCDFCKKKIWLKEANQCTSCGLISHKRCVSRYKQTTCDMGGLRHREPKSSENPSDHDGTPEIIMTSDDYSPVKPETSKNARHTLGSLLTHMTGSSSSNYLSCGVGRMKRSGSATSLAPPNAGEGGILSKSLPPSPQHSPRQSRKTSLCGNPFLLEEQHHNMEQYIENVLERVIAYPHDEHRITMARESAADVFKNYDPETRLQKIEQACEILLERLGAEGKKRVNLAMKEREAVDSDDAVGKTRLALQISACDNVTQALAHLTMHFITAQELCAQATTKEK